MYVRSEWIFFIYNVSKNGIKTKYIFPQKTQTQMLWAYMDTHPFGPKNTK